MAKMDVEMFAAELVPNIR